MVFDLTMEAIFAKARLASKLSEAPGRLVFQEPAHAILAEAERVGANFIAIGRRGRTQAARPLLGSVSLRIAMNADATVLVAP